MTIVWKWTIRYLPRAGWSNPDRSRIRGVSMAPPATTTMSASLVCDTPSGPMNSTPVARRPCVMIRLTYVSAISSARPVAIARLSSATGSPLA